MRFNVFALANGLYTELAANVVDDELPGVGDEWRVSKHIGGRLVTTGYIVARRRWHTTTEGYRYCDVLVYAEAS